MSEIISTIRGHPRRAILFGTGISVSVVAIQYLWRRYFSTRHHNSKNAVWRLSDRCEIDARAFNAAVDNLEALLADMEPQRFSSDLSRGKYDLITSIISRLRGICVDVQRFVSEDFRKKLTTEDIARTLWNERSAPNARAGTLSVFSDESYATALDELNDEASIFESVAPSDVDLSNLDLYKEGINAANEGKVQYRKSRAEFCKCETEQSYAAKVYCLRQAFYLFAEDEHRLNWLIQSGRVVIADLLRHSGHEVGSFYIAYDRIVEFVSKPENKSSVMEELAPRKVEQLNLWDVLFDFIILDAFEDLKKPPNSITALVKNTWLGTAMKEAAINNIIWSLIKIKRTRLQNADGFISRFYDISGIVTGPLTLGLLGGGSPEFEEMCTFFKDSILAFVVDIFNIDKVRYTTVEELRDDVDKLMTERVELIHVKLSNEILPAQQY